MQVKLVQRYDGMVDFQSLLDQAVQLFGPQLCSKLMQNITGEAARSELSMLTQPLKKLIVGQPKAKMWMTQALEGNDTSNKRVGEAEKRLWLQKIFR